MHKIISEEIWLFRNLIQVNLDKFRSTISEIIIIKTLRSKKCACLMQAKCSKSHQVLVRFLTRNVKLLTATHISYCNCTYREAWGHSGIFRIKKTKSFYLHPLRVQTHLSFRNKKILYLEVFVNFRFKWCRRTTNTTISLRRMPKKMRKRRDPPNWNISFPPI